ncbi:hypothetical protein CRG98_006462 [Punica granatum]|uniref:Integrase catalytic domain-containing protein n=1 Tax=Punica granatum TaxID=22663 RepID=A0A2I0KXR6_PUNGR|nr:hypothetical protein CRG98_006462 [Punica granatum]
MALLRLSRWTMLFSYCSWFHDRKFAFDCRMMNSVPSFGRKFSRGKPVGQNEVLTTTMWGTICYRVMPFGLKNAGATYQRAMEVVVYVDDMIAKSKEREDHLVNLKRLFDRLKEYKLRLNSAKCTFGARSGKLLGFVVSELGIEVDPDKVKAIRELPPLSSVREADPLKYLLDSPSSTRNLTKWCCQLTEYDIEYVSRTSVKGQAIADHLAEFPIEDHTPINPDFPDEGILQVDDEGEKPGWKMYFDGAVNSTGSGIGAVLISPDRYYYPVGAKIDFPCTNNVAEYETKDTKLVPYHEYLEKLTENFEDISFTYTPRMTNQFADALATLASMVSITKENLIEPLEIEIVEGPAHCNSIEASEAKPWYEDIKNLLRTGRYHPFTDRRDRKTLRRLAIHYFLSGEILYRRSFDFTLLRCIDEHESRRLMEEVHGGNCGPHMNGLMLAEKIMRLGYYWSTMETDCVKHVRHCYRCQVYADQIKAPPNELRPMTAPWPFSMWGMDVIGPINPKASNGHMFILVAIDYFTKWIEAVTLASVTAKVVARFLRRDIIARYGVSATIITDNAKNLNNKVGNLFEAA